MTPVAIGLLAFGLALAGIFLGSIMQRTLPKGISSVPERVLLSPTYGKRALHPTIDICGSGGEGA
jgi:hypothetical protein